MGLFSKRGQPTLYEVCEALFAHSWHAVQKDRASCAKDFLLLAVPGGGYYHLTRPHGRRPTYGLFPAAQYAGHGSFAGHDGGFVQHGLIGEADFERIVTTGVPE